MASILNSLKPESDLTTSLMPTQLAREGFELRICLPVETHPYREQQIPSGNKDGKKTNQAGKQDSPHVCLEMLANPNPASTGSPYFPQCPFQKAPSGKDSKFSVESQAPANQRWLANGF
jgi:hypothetical protein